MKQRPIMELMFHANDQLKHDVYFSELANCWCIENERGLCDDYSFGGMYASLAEALDRMNKATNVPLELFSVSNNPYYFID